MYGSGGGGQNQSDQTASFFWVLVMICGVMLLVWYLKPQWVVIPVYSVRTFEIILMKYLLIGWSHIAAFFHLPVPSAEISMLSKLQDYAHSVDPRIIKFSEFSQFNVYVGDYARYPIMLIMLCLAGYIYTKHTGRKFNTVFSMKSLRKAEQENWPCITPVISIDLVNEDLEKGPWAMAKVPLEFCKEHHLAFAKKIGEVTVWSLDTKAAYHVLAMQMGRHWKGVHALPIHVKALVVIFIACAVGEREKANHFLAQIASSASSGKLNFTGVEQALEQYKNSNILEWIDEHHAFVYTALASLLKIARSDGVLATAEFLWVKPVDRELWYMLNSVGRQTAVVEVSGCFAHWLAEVKLGAAIKTPMVKQAVDALQEALENVLFDESTIKWLSSAA